MFKNLIKSINNYLTKPNNLGWSDKYKCYVTTHSSNLTQWTSLWSQDKWGRWSSHTSYGIDIDKLDK